MEVHVVDLDRVRLEPEHGGLLVVVDLHAGQPRARDGELYGVAPHLPLVRGGGGDVVIINTRFFKYLLILLNRLTGVVAGQIVHFSTDSFHAGLGSLSDVGLAVGLEVGESLLKVFVGRADSAPEPGQRVLHIPLDDLPALGARAAGLDHLPRSLAILGQLLPGLSSVLWPHQFHWNIIHNFSIHRHGHFREAVGGK